MPGEEVPLLKRFAERWAFRASTGLFICLSVFSAFFFSLIVTGAIMTVLSAVLGEFSEEAWETAVIPVAVVFGPFTLGFMMEHAPEPDYEVKQTLDPPY